MANYKLSNSAKEDLIRIHHHGVKKFGVIQADKYFESFFEYFDIIAQRPFSFESIVGNLKGSGNMFVLFENIQEMNKMDDYILQLKILKESKTQKWKLKKIDSAKPKKNHVAGASYEDHERNFGTSDWKEVLKSFDDWKQKHS